MFYIRKNTHGNMFFYYPHKLYFSKLGYIQMGKISTCLSEIGKTCGWKRAMWIKEIREFYLNKS